MNIWIQKWWDKESKQFSIISYYDSWSKNGTGMRFAFWTNGAEKGNLKDTCLDITLQLFYLSINYTNFNYQGGK